MMRHFKKQKGFTLIELMIVVVLIGVLSGVVISIVNAGGFRSKARDSQRIADLEKIRSSLELYFSDNRSYPDVGWIEVTGADALSNLLEPVYLNKVPSDPANDSAGNSNPCSNPDSHRYNYTSVASGGEYVLTSIMEIASSNDGNECDSLNNWSSGSWCASFGTQDFCYGVENP